MAGIILNDDFMRFVNSKYHENYVFGEVGETDIREYIRKLEGTTVTDFVFNVNAQLSYSPSDLWMTAEEKYNTTEEKGHPVNFKDSFYKVWYDIFVLQKLDMYSIWIEELNRLNINPWISFRLNDTHDNHIEYGGIRRAPFFESARSRGLTRTNHREKAGYFDDCLDFKHEEVRRYNLDYIREQLASYDVYGVEIDYMREPYICSPGEEDSCREIMYKFFSEIKEIMAEAEERYGHKIKLSVRCFRDAVTTFDAGLDIFRLIREGLIDLVIPTPRYHTCDSDMPIYQWRRIFEKDSVEIAAGCDILYRSCKDDAIHVNRETLCALAMQYQTNGADYIYLFNHTYLDDFDVYDYLGDTDRLANKERRHIVSYQDVGYIYSTLYRPLPMKLTDMYQFLRIQTGRINEGSKVVLRLGCDKPLSDVYVNSKRCKFLGTCAVEKEYYDGEALEFEITKYNQNDQVAELRCIEGATLSYAEIHVIPRCP